MKKAIEIMVSVFILIPLLYFINIEILKVYLAFLILMTVAINAIFFFVDIQAKPPISTVLKYTITEEKFKNRKVFIMKSKENDILSDKYIFYIHGGAYVMEATYKHWQFLEDAVNCCHLEWFLMHIKNIGDIIRQHFLILEE